MNYLSQEPIGLSDKEHTTGEAVQGAQTQTENNLQVVVCSTPLSELSPTSVTRSLSSAPSPTVPEQRLSSSKVNNVHVPEVEKKKPSRRNTLSPVSVVRASASDGYNWRKYGQKQVKSPTGSRSYYRCTHSDCSAKKIECCDHSGHVVEVVYKSTHTHDPPRKTNSTRESKLASSKQLTVQNNAPEKPMRVLNDSSPCPSSKEPPQEAPCSPDKKRQNPSDHSENGKVDSEEEHVTEPEPKRRQVGGYIYFLQAQKVVHKFFSYFGRIYLLVV